jgi:hypothetical protein
MSSVWPWLGRSCRSSRRASTRASNGCPGALQPTRVFRGPTRRRSACCRFALAALLSASLPAGAASFDVTRESNGFNVVASADIDADPTVAWDTVTDYEHLPHFVPAVLHVRVLARQSDGARQRLLVEQTGELRFLFFVQRIGVLLDVRHQPPTRVEARALPRAAPARDDEASVTDFEGTYMLAPIAGGVRLDYRARFAPTFDLPPILGTLAVRQTMKRQFDALVAEIGRRQRALRPSGS